MLVSDICSIRSVLQCWASPGGFYAIQGSGGKTLHIGNMSQRNAPLELDISWSLGASQNYSTTTWKRSMDILQSKEMALCKDTSCLFL